MFIRATSIVLGAALTISGLGCGGGETVPTADLTTDSAGDRSQLKSMLEGAAASGHLGSGVALVENSIKELESTDAELATALSSDLAEFREAESNGQEDSAKAIAQRMVDRL